MGDIDFLDMLWIAVLTTFAVKGCAIYDTEKKVDNIEQSLKNQPRFELQLRHENVIGGPAPEEFYDIGGQRFYSKIDDKPVESLYQTEKK